MKNLLLEVSKGEWKAHSNGVHSGTSAVAVAYDPGGSGEVAAANARLIAASKEMFAALHDAITDAEFYLANNLGPKSCVESWLPAARAAMEKAGAL